MTLTVMLMGCATNRNSFSGPGNPEQALQKANRLYEAREYYSARQCVQKVLEKNPADLEAQNMMGKILDKEIERQKEFLIPKAVEEMDNDERQDEIKTWLERSRSLFSSKQYDLALFAAEKVFLYDADNPSASDLIDEIKRQALKEGKSETLFIHKMYEEEIADRLTKYRLDAEALFQEGRVGQAKFTLEKILLLEPDDPKALKLYQTVVEQEPKEGMPL